MEKAELKEGLRLWRKLIVGLQGIVADPEAIARMQRRASENPALLLGPTLDEYLGVAGRGGESEPIWDVEGEDS